LEDRESGELTVFRTCIAGCHAAQTGMAKANPGAILEFCFQRQAPDIAVFPSKNHIQTVHASAS